MSYGQPSANNGKRRRIDDGPARVPAGARMSAPAARTMPMQPGAERNELVHVPRLDLADLPPESIHKYLLQFGLIPPHPLDYHHATHPPTVAGLRATQLAGPPMIQRLDKAGRIKTRTVTYEPTSFAPRAYQQQVDDPPTLELIGPPAAEQDPRRADERLINLAKQHWAVNVQVKEGESVSSFVFSLRKRGRAHN